MGEGGGEGDFCVWVDLDGCEEEVGRKREDS